MHVNAIGFNGHNIQYKQQAFNAARMNDAAHTRFSAMTLKKLTNQGKFATFKQQMDQILQDPQRPNPGSKSNTAHQESLPTLLAILGLLQRMKKSSNPRRKLLSNYSGIRLNCPMAGK